MEAMPKEALQTNDKDISIVLKHLGIEESPFKRVLSFDPLIQVLRDRAQKGSAAEKMYAERVIEKMETVPEFCSRASEGKIHSNDQSVLELLDMLMLTVIPPAQRNQRLAKVFPPLDMTSIYETPAFTKLMEENEVSFSIQQGDEMTKRMVIINGCSAILNKFYGQQIEPAFPLQIKIKDRSNQKVRYFKIAMDLSFVDIKPIKPLIQLTEDQIHELLSDTHNLELWLQYLPPENFEFHGFVIGDLVDVTNEITLSSIRYRLLQKDGVVLPKNFKELQSLVQTYLQMPDIQLGLTAIDYPIEKAVSHKYKIRFDFLAAKHECLLNAEYQNSIYERACRNQQSIIVEDLNKLKNKTQLELDLLQQNIQSILIAPLQSNHGEIIGILEIGSSTPYRINSFVESKIQELVGLFAMAVDRSREEIDNKIEAIIREQFTAIHPSVEWRFIEAAFNLLEHREKHPDNGAIEPIVFQDVYPLYGQSDIVGSSTKRNAAIQADLIDNLKRAQHLLIRIIEELPLPLADHFLLAVENDLQSLQQSFNSNDETRIVEMLHYDIHPLFADVASQNALLKPAIVEYQQQIDPHLSMIYKERKAYEDSVSIINNSITQYLKGEESKSQQIIPHYFEKYKTDGIEYDIYVGEEILPNNRYHALHLKNLKLWQLISMCEITRLVANLQEELIVPLTTAQLIFAYGSKLSIQFRMDEKQFDVDGAYNVRYEILKKRIDKAVIEGTNDRLTISGHVAIVYLQEKDRQEYLQYIEYLRKRNFVDGPTEDLTLGKLQGVQGLRALRFKVAP